MRNPYTCQSHLTPRVQGAKSSSTSAGERRWTRDPGPQSWFALIALRLNYYFEVSNCYSCSFVLLFIIFFFFFNLYMYILCSPTFIMILRKCFKAKRKFMHIAYVNSSLVKNIIKILRKRKEICIFAFQFAASMVKGCSICSLLSDLIVNKNSPSGKFVGQTNWNWNVQFMSGKSLGKIFGIAFKRQSIEDPIMHGNIL